MQTVQAYVDAFQAQGEDVEKRLVGWTQVALAPGERRMAEIVIRPQLLATYDLSERDWRIAAGNYTLRLGSSSLDLPVGLSISMPAQTLRLVRVVAPWASRDALVPGTYLPDSGELDDRSFPDHGFYQA